MERMTGTVTGFLGSALAGIHCAKNFHVVTLEVSLNSLVRSDRFVKFVGLL